MGSPGEPGQVGEVPAAHSLKLDFEQIGGVRSSEKVRDFDFVLDKGAYWDHCVADSEVVEGCSQNNRALVGGTSLESCFFHHDLENHTHPGLRLGP